MYINRSKRPHTALTASTRSRKFGLTLPAAVDHSFFVWVPCGQESLWLSVYLKQEKKNEIP